jgi:hypothetical protein
MDSALFCALHLDKRKQGTGMKKQVLLNMIAAAGLGVAAALSGCAPVTVSSTPADANVYYKNSNKLIGPAPVTVTLVANEKQVVVRKDGYFSKTVKLSPIDPENINVELRRRDKVLLLSRPNGAELFITGRDEKIGRTPYLLDYDKPHRTFSVRSPGYITKTMTIPEDPEGHVVVELTKLQALVVVSKPKNVEVYDQNGQKLGVTPLTVPVLKDGMIELRKEGYHALKVPISPETVSPHMVELQRQPIIIVSSDPENALVVHRGVTLGKTPYRHLVNADMELEIMADRHYTRQITIAPDSPRQVRVKLDPKPYITVNSSPAGAKLYRSGGVEFIGETPVQILVEKDTSLEMHKPGYDIKPFMLSSDSSREVTVPLVQSLAALEKTVLIDSTPSGALVYRPGGAELIGQTPLKQRVRSERTLELQLSGFKTKIVTIAPDSADSIVFALAKDESAGNVTISDPLLNTPSSF